MLNVTFVSGLYIFDCSLRSSLTFILWPYLRNNGKNILHKLLKTFIQIYYLYKDLTCKYSSTCRNLIKIFNLCFYDDVINKDKTYKSDTCRHVISFKFLFCEDYDLELWFTLWDMFSLSYDIYNILVYSLHPTRN